MRNTKWQPSVSKIVGIYRHKKEKPKLKNIPTSLISVIIKGFYKDIEYYIYIKYEMYTTKNYVCILSLYMYNFQRF